MHSTFGDNEKASLQEGSLQLSSRSISLCPETRVCVIFINRVLSYLWEEGREEEEEKKRTDSRFHCLGNI